MSNLSAVDTLHGAVAHHSARNPDRPAIICDGEVISYKALASDMDRIAMALQSRGIEPGERVLVATARKDRFLADLLGAARAGLIPVPFAGSDADLLAIAVDAEAAAVMGDEHLRERASGFPLPCPIVDSSVLEPRRQSGVLEDVPGDESGIGMLVYTSGTTSGVRRGVMQSFGVLAATVRYMNRFQGLTDEARELVVPPLHHAFGLGRCRAVLHAGGTLVLTSGQFNPATVCDALLRYECNALSGVSSSFAIILDSFERFFLPCAQRLRWLEIGSVQLSPRHRTRLVELLPTARIMFNYGLTEAMRSTLLSFHEAPSKRNSFGRSAPGNRLQIFDENGARLGHGESGRIAVAGANLAAGYWRQHEAWNSRLIDDYFDTGDVGFVDRDGYLTVLGRRDDVINVGGEKVHPDEVELALRPYFADREFTVIGVPDPKGALGQVVAVCFEGDAPPLARVQQPLRGALGHTAQMPQRVVELSAFPRTANGKVVRAAVRRAIEQSNGDSTLST